MVPVHIFCFIFYLTYVTLTLEAGTYFISLYNLYILSSLDTFTLHILTRITWFTPVVMEIPFVFQSHNNDDKMVLAYIFIFLFDI
jgi:hypothetical protein